MTTLNLETATSLVMEATTQKAINFAKNVINYPASNAVKSVLTPLQKKLMLEQLEINSCSLEVNGYI